MNINYNSKVQKQALKKRWDVLQIIWTAYNSYNWSDSIIIPIRKLVIKGRSNDEIDSIISDLQKKGCFKEWAREKEIYVIENINHDKFDKLYAKVENIYKKFIDNSREKVSGKTINSNQKTVQKMELVGGEGIKDLQNTLREITQIKKKDKNRFPYKIPSGTKWQDFIIKFEDNENIFIQIKQFKHYTDYKKMGMIGRGKNPNPSETWIFLKVLSQVNCELTIKDIQARDKYKKQKELLSKALQNYFMIEYDPFYPYHSSSEKSGDSYKIKITLIPPPNQEEKVNMDRDDDGDLETKKYFEEQTSQVHENQWRN